MRQPFYWGLLLNQLFVFWVLFFYNLLIQYIMSAFDFQDKTFQKRAGY